MAPLSLVPLATAARRVALVALVAAPGLPGCGAASPTEAPPSMVPFPGTASPALATAAPAAPAAASLAAPGGERSVFEPCTRFVRGAQGELEVFAVHAYPGRSVAELASVRAIGRLAGASPGEARGERVPPGYDAFTPLRVYLRDGEVSVHCGSLDDRREPGSRLRVVPYRGDLPITGVTFVLSPAP